MTQPCTQPMFRSAVLLSLLISSVWACAGDRASTDLDTPVAREARTAAPDAATGAPVEPVRLDVTWRTRLVGSGLWDWAPLEFSQPALCCGNEKLVVGTSTGLLSVVDIHKGKPQWSYDTSGRIDARPVMDSDDDTVVFFGNDEGDAFAVELGRGLRWKANLGGEIDSAAAVADGRVFFMTSNEVLHAYDTKTGELLWEYNDRKVPDYFTLRGLSEPVVWKDKVFCGFADGKFAALEAETGEVIWIRDLSDGETKFVDVDARPVISGGRLYITSYAGGVYALNVETGKILWHTTMTGASTIAVSSNLVYTTTSGRYVMALNPESGKIQWRVRHKDAIPTDPTVLGKYLLYGSTDNGVYVLDRNRGEPVVQFDPDAGFSAPITVVDTHVYMFSNNGILYGFEMFRDRSRR